ncbi:MAG: hypothetical protein FJW37_11290, partial [Acidobacteria bacterium]|nr:hypothetical protein [Acidobacteriota bacterium]
MYPDHAAKEEHRSATDPRRQPSKENRLIGVYPRSSAVSFFPAFLRGSEARRLPPAAPCARSHTPARVQRTRPFCAECSQGAGLSAGAALLVRLLLRPLGRDRLRTALTVLAIALGVAVVLAIELAGQAAAGSFRASLENLVGKTDLEILANGGVEETWMGALAALPVNARFAPVLEDRAMIPGAGPVTVFGVDLVAASRGGADSATATGADPAAAAVLSQALARRLGRGRGAGVQVIFGDTPERLEITGVIEAGLAEFLLLDIAR